MRIRHGVLLAWLLVVVVAPLHAGSLFEDGTPLKVELTGPLGSLVESKNDKEEWPFRLHLDGLELDLMVRARGNSRLRVCDFPPLRFNFESSDAHETPFEGQGKVKLVTRCRKVPSSRNDVLEEYAAYRIFSLFSDTSHRVRLLEINYNDTDNEIKQKYVDGYAFLIEPLDQLADRVKGSVSEIPGVAHSQLDKEQAALVYVFQYLIGNTDWSFVPSGGEETCCHNVDLIEIDSKQFPVPYDFDLAGIVNAKYARPDPSLKIEKVWQRLYRGYCTEPEHLRTALDSITSNEAEAMRVISELPGMTEKEKAKRVDYLETFFKKAARKDRLVRSFERACKG